MNSKSTRSLISQSRYSDFVASVIDPSKGPVSAPDDINQEHVLRQETVTSNVTVGASRGGIFVLYPNHPTNLIGAHYTVSGSTITFEHLLKTAQELPQSFNATRKVQQVIQLLNTTVPAGSFALSGTFNAVEFQGSLSEVDSIKYNLILSINTDPVKKIGNIPCGQGIAVIATQVLFKIGIWKQS